MNLLTVSNLNVYHKSNHKNTPIIKNISFSVAEGSCLVILGESGSGKSLTWKAIVGLLSPHFEVSGSALFQENNLLTQSQSSLLRIRGKEISIILQNPMSCFDGLYRIKDQMKETFQMHTNWSKKEIHQQSIQALQKMKLASPEKILNSYPHQLSGGTLQRIMIAIATTTHPKILIADEPTTAIDAITKFEIMKEFQTLKQQNMTMIFITHDLSVASMIADYVIVLHEGEIIEQGTFQEISNNPKAHYTKLLVEKRLAVQRKYQKILTSP